MTTQLQIPIYACLIDVYHEMDTHSIVEPHAPSLTMETADLAIEHAVSTTSRLFGFWRAIQKTGIDLGNMGIRIYRFICTRCNPINKSDFKVDSKSQIPYR